MLQEFLAKQVESHGLKGGEVSTSKGTERVGAGIDSAKWKGGYKK